MMSNLFVIAATAALCATLLVGCAAGQAYTGEGLAGSAAQSHATTEQAEGSGTGADGGTGVGAGNQAADGTAQGSGNQGTTPEAAATGQAETARPAYSPDAFQDALDHCTAYQLDTAGGSLKTAIAAAALTEFLATQCRGDDLPALVADAGDWYGELNAEQRQALAQNWPSVLQLAQSIAADPVSQQELLGEAGVATDFSALPLQEVPALLDGLDGVLKNAG